MELPLCSSTAGTGQKKRCSMHQLDGCRTPQQQQQLACPTCQPSHRRRLLLPHRVAVPRCKHVAPAHHLQAAGRGMAGGAGSGPGWYRRQQEPAPASHALTPGTPGAEPGSAQQGPACLERGLYRHRAAGRQLARALQRAGVQLGGRPHSHALEHKVGRDLLAAGCREGGGRGGAVAQAAPVAAAAGGRAGRFKASRWARAAGPAAACQQPRTQPQQAAAAAPPWRAPRWRSRRRRT